MFMQSYNFWLINFELVQREQLWTVNMEHVCSQQCFMQYVSSSTRLVQHTANFKNKISSLQQDYGFWIWNLKVNLNHKINKSMHCKIKVFAISHQPIMLLNIVCAACVGVTFEWMHRIQIGIRNSATRTLKYIHQKLERPIVQQLWTIGIDWKLSTLFVRKLKIVLKAFKGLRGTWFLNEIIRVSIYDSYVPPVCTMYFLLTNKNKAMNDRFYVENC